MKVAYLAVEEETRWKSESGPTCIRLGWIVSYFTMYGIVRKLSVPRHK